MKNRAVFVRISALVVVLAMVSGVGAAWAQPKKSGGLMGAFSGQEDPTKDRGPEAGDKLDDKDKTPPPAEPKKTQPGLVYSAPDPEQIDKRIAYIKGLDYDKMERVPPMEAAKRRIDYLRKRAERLRVLNDKETTQIVDKLAAHKKIMEERWLTFAAAIKDGKKRTTKDWADLADGVFGSGVEIELPSKDADKEADDILGLPGPEDLLLEEDVKPSEDEVDPLKPVEAPTTEIKTTPPKLEDLIAAVRGLDKPETMHPLTWARLMDSFGQDLAEFQAAFAAAMKRLAEKRRTEYQPVVDALKAAQNTYTNLEKLGESGEAMRRHLTRRIYEAELAQLELERNDLQQLAKEREGDKSDRPLSIRTNPMAPENTLNDLARMMEVSGTAGPPAPDAFEGLGSDGLPDLYPPGSKTVVDKEVQYGNLVEANIARYQRMLNDVHKRMANAEAMVRQREQRILRRKASELREKDRLEGKAGHPLNEAYNRRTLRKLQQELVDSRTEHIVELKSKLDEKAQAIVKKLEAEFKRRDAMRAAEKPKPTE